MNTHVIRGASCQSLSTFVFSVATLLGSTLPSLSHGTESNAVTPTKEVLTTNNSKSSGGMIAHNVVAPNTDTAQRKLAAKTTTAQRHLGNTWIYDADFEYLTDNDGDGYHHRFRVSFDADTQWINDRVYAKLYLDDHHEEQLYYVTDDFTIIGNASSDRYEVTTTLTGGYDSDRYDIRIDLFDAHTHEPLDSLRATDDEDLYGRFLETVNLDSQSTVFSIQELSIVLTGDRDHDGYFPLLEITVDADVSYGSEWVELAVFIMDSDNNTTELYRTEEYLISGFASSDSEISDISLDAGYAPDSYHIRAEIRQAETGVLLATSDTHRQTGLAIESKDYDDYADYADDDDHRSSESSGHGGALGSLFLLPLAALLFIRRRLER